MAMPLREQNMSLSTVTRSKSIQVPYDTLFNFLAEPYNLTYWSIVDVTSVTQGEGRWWHVMTLAGSAQARIRSNPVFGVVDFDFKFADAQWLIPTRLLPYADSCEYLVTLFARTPFGRGLFDHQVALIDQKLDLLKELMELGGRCEPHHEDARVPK
jgi:hypothetical protein